MRTETKIAIERRHLLDVPGGRPIEVDFSTKDGCASCTPRTSNAGDVLHEAECPAARTLAADQVDQDVTADGGAELADEARALFAGEYADVVLEDDARVVNVVKTPGLSDDELAPLRDELSLAYLTGFRRAERATLGMARAGIARIRDEMERLSSRVEAWAPARSRGDEEHR